MLPRDFWLWWRTTVAYATALQRVSTKSKLTNCWNLSQGLHCHPLRFNRFAASNCKRLQESKKVEEFAELNVVFYVSVFMSEELRSESIQCRDSGNRIRQASISSSLFQHTTWTQVKTVSWQSAELTLDRMQGRHWIAVSTTNHHVTMANELPLEVQTASSGIIWFLSNENWSQTCIWCRKEAMLRRTLHATSMLSSQSMFGPQTANTLTLLWRCVTSPFTSEVSGIPALDSCLQKGRMASISVSKILNPRSKAGPQRSELSVDVVTRCFLMNTRIQPETCTPIWACPWMSRTPAPKTNRTASARMWKSIVDGSIRCQSKSYVCVYIYYVYI